MGLYQRLFAHGLALGDDAQHRLYGDRKRALFAGLSGTVVESGPGTGINLPYLPRNIRWIGIEPNPHMHPFIHKAASEQDIEIELRAAPASETGLLDDSADAVISTLVLCSVPDLDAVLAEIKRILKPGGRFVFIEHVAAPADSWLRTLQRSIKPIWKPLADGCHPDRETTQAIERAGFADVHYETFRADLPVVSPHVIGTAVMPADAPT
jgi:ubiquinone/menaquinone biosynthesis C-methylase UbiE